MRKLRKRDEFDISYDSEQDLLVIHDKVKQLYYSATSTYLIHQIVKIPYKNFTYKGLEGKSK